MDLMLRNVIAHKDLLVSSVRPTRAMEPVSQSIANKDALRSGDELPVTRVHVWSSVHTTDKNS